MAITQNGIYYPSDGEQPADILKDLKEMAESIDQSIEKEVQENKYDDTEIKQEQQIQNEKISENTETNILQQKQIENLQNENALLKSQIPTGEEKDEYISIKDSSNMQFKKFEIGGNTYQETSEASSNILDPNRLTKGFINTETGELEEINPSYPNASYTPLIDLKINDTINIYKNPTAGARIRVYNLDGTYKETSREWLNYTATENCKVRALFLDTILDTTNIKINSLNSEYEEFIPNKPSIGYQSDVRACGDNINISPTNINDWEQGTINVNTGGNDKSTTRIRTINYCNIDNINEDYYISLEDENYVLVNIAMFNKDDSFIGPYNTMVDTKINGAKELKVNFSTTNTKKIKVIVRRKDNSNIMPNEIINIKPKLTKSSVKTPWSPYGMGSMEISKSNKNILNSKLMIGIANINFIDIKVKPNTKWTFSSNIPKTYDGSNAFIFATTKKHNYTTAGNGVWEGQKRTITADEEGYISLGYRKDSNINSFDDYWYQIEEGEVATTPIPHESENYVVPTQEPFYEGDTFVKIDRIRYEKHLYEKIILTGDEDSWSKSSNTTVDRFVKNNPKQLPFYKGASNCFFYSSQSNKIGTFYIDDVGGDLYAGRIIINYSEPGTTTLEQFKSKLSELHNAGMPIYIIYPLATPKLIPCTKEQNEILDEIENSSTYKNVTYIYSNDEISPIFDIEYYKDLDTIINNTKKETQSQIDEIKELLSTTGTSAMLLENLKTDLESEV